ncbi:protein kinase domain-containing protein [Streptomyces sp. NBC_00503]|uniref:protein kinase domain-containing protein n=1 Tax=Streptomyces sp. NBC_00503 TaxID=2903659 RepID=UPI002E81C802|nr:protein kinase [Streptomyces sp. NBC_00503]WUD83401.1 protein kinase [Streptomyces sp. NBC_00503]
MGDQLAGRYRLDQRLGQGGMGEVWRAHDTALDRAVAVKVLLEAATNDEVVARFRREATIGARLQHPGITVVHDVGQEEGRLFIVMELLPGEDLRSALAREPGGLAVEVALELAAQTAEALAAAHERSVIHRDLKPANLFLLPGGRLKICDFGIAHSSDATAGWTVTGRIFGSPPYMAPEQWRGERVDARCDLYALGCVLYALLSGEPPFGESADGPYVLMRRHIEDPPLPLREAGRPVAPEVDRLVLHLLAKDAADRPESAAVVAKSLRGLLGGLLDGSGGRGPADGDRDGDGDGARTGFGRDTRARDGAGRDPRTGAGTAVTDRSGAGAGAGAGAAGQAGAERRTGTGRERTGLPGGTGGGGGSGAGNGSEATGGTGSGLGSGAGAGGVPVGVREFVRELLLEAEDALRAVPVGSEVPVEVLAVAADAAARFDAGLAGRLLAEAESAAWSGGGGDGARVAGLLTGLAKDTSARAPARARRLLTDAQQALFTVFGPDREGPLRAVAFELARVAPEQAARIATDHFTGGPSEKRLRAHIATAVAAADPAEAELQLALIPDAGLRGAATYDMVLAVAPRDLPAALRLSERIGSAGGRLLALCQVARDRAGARDQPGAAQVLEQAEQELPGFLEERAAWLREESARHAEQGRPVEAERLLGRAAGLLRGRTEASDDEKTGHALASLARARAAVEEAARPPLDPEAARERAGRARNLPDAAERARALARIARECVATGSAPWLAEAAADAGSSPPSGATALGGPDSGAPAARGSRSLTGSPGPHAAPGALAWQTAARPDAVHAAGAHVVWRSGPEVGCVRADVGATRWTARADEGVGAAAPPLVGAGLLRVSCAADAATVYVEVRREGAPGVRLLAREPRDGRVRWWRDLPGEGALRSAGPVVLHGAPGDLTALSAKTGEVLWRRAPAGSGVRSPAVAGDCLVLPDDRLVQALHLPTGRLLWSFPRSRPADRTLHGQLPSGGGGPVALLDGEGLLALDRNTGRELWRFAPGVPAEPLLSERGTVYAAAYRPDQGADLVFALDAESGALRWQRALTRREGPGCALELLGVRPGGLYVKVLGGGRRGLLNRSAGPFVAVLDPATGKLRRQWDHPALVDAAALLIGDRLALSRPELAAYALP